MDLRKTRFLGAPLRPRGQSPYGVARLGACWRSRPGTTLGEAEHQSPANVAPKRSPALRRERGYSAILRSMITGINLVRRPRRWGLARPALKDRSLRGGKSCGRLNKNSLTARRPYTNRYTPLSTLSNIDRRRSALSNSDSADGVPGVTPAQHGPRTRPQPRCGVTKAGHKKMRRSGAGEDTGPASRP